MRATALDVLRHPSWLVVWWEDLPGRKRWWWSALLFEPGGGWLRWGVDSRDDSFNGPPEPYTIAPPLRRLALFLRYTPHRYGWKCWSMMRRETPIR